MTTLKNTPLKTFKKALLVVACSTLGAVGVNAQADDVAVPDTIHWTIPFGVGDRCMGTLFQHLDERPDSR